MLSYSLKTNNFIKDKRHIKGILERKTMFVYMTEPINKINNLNDCSATFWERVEHCSSN